jgi:hypothetical protein
MEKGTFQKILVDLIISFSKAEEDRQYLLLDDMTIVCAYVIEYQFPL